MAQHFHHATEGEPFRDLLAGEHHLAELAAAGDLVVHELAPMGSDQVGPWAARTSLRVCRKSV